MSPDNTNAERQARWRAKQHKARAAMEAELRALRNDGGRAKAGADAALAKELAQAKARIAELEAQRDTALAELKAARPAAAGGRDAPARTGRPLERPSELDKLKAENVRLRALLREDPDAAKLRKKVVGLQARAHSMRVVMKQIAKDRDTYRSVSLWLRRVGRERLDRRVFTTIAKCLHPDRLEKCSKAELDDAGRFFLELKPLFTT